MVPKCLYKQETMNKNLIKERKMSSTYAVVRMFRSQLILHPHQILIDYLMYSKRHRFRDLIIKRNTFQVLQNSCIMFFKLDRRVLCWEIVLEPFAQSISFPSLFRTRNSTIAISRENVISNWRSNVVTKKCQLRQEKLPVLEIARLRLTHARLLASKILFPLKRHHHIIFFSERKSELINTWKSAFFIAILSPITMQMRKTRSKSWKVGSKFSGGTKSSLPPPRPPPSFPPPPPFLLARTIGCGWGRKLAAATALNGVDGISI